jgi:hypothetical protein
MASAKKLEESFFLHHLGNTKHFFFTSVIKKMLLHSGVSSVESWQSFTKKAEVDAEASQGAVTNRSELTPI